MKNIILLLCLCFAHYLTAQDQVLNNKIYQDNIRTVRLHLLNLPVSHPVIHLRTGASLFFSFDDVDGEVKDYVYTLQHCNKDWTPSDLSELEYIDGFIEGDIRNYDFSYQVYTDYVYYQLGLPNNDLRFTKSGNYVLKVYEEDSNDEEKLVIVRRFVVVEPLIVITAEMNMTNRVGKQRTHQEIDFEVVYDDIELRAPRESISATVIQNGRWETAITDIRPLFIKEKRLIFDYQDKIVFPAGKEWRFLDLRELVQTNGKIEEIEEYEDGYDIILQTDKKRANLAHFNRIDLNGNFVIGNYNRIRKISAEITRSQRYSREQNLNSDYLLTYFSLDSPTELYKEDVYIYGALTGWELKEEFKMTYNDSDFMYETKAWLKQGYYDYAYVTVPEGKTTIDFEALEGNWYETENEYLIIIYYRPFGERYDRVLGVSSFSSQD